MHLYLFEWICLFVLLNEQFKDSLKDRLLPPPCGEIMKVFWLTARLEHARRWNINRKKSLVSQIRGAELTVYIYIYIYANNRLTIWFSGLCFMWNVILSFSSIYFTSCFTAIWFWFHWFLNITLLDRNTYTQIYIYMAVIPHTALLSHSKLPQGKFLHRDLSISLISDIRAILLRDMFLNASKFNALSFHKCTSMLSLVLFFISLLKEKKS